MAMTEREPPRRRPLTIGYQLRHGAERPTADLLRRLTVVSNDNEPYYGPPRPVKRVDCEPCPTCQAYQESLVIGQPVARIGRLSCGHELGLALNHCRPCVRWSCRHNLAANVTEDGGLVVTRPDLEPTDPQPSCARDYERQGGMEAAEVGELLNMTPERVGQIERVALAKMREGLAELGVRPEDWVRAIGEWEP